MFGLTTTRRLRTVEAERDQNARLLAEAYSAHDTAQDRALHRRIAYRRRLTRALRACARWRTHAAKEHRDVRLLAEQLLNATGEHNPAARRALGLPDDGPWESAIEGLNALVDAGEIFHVENGDISSSSGDKRITWDSKAGRWRLAHDDADQAGDEALRGSGT
ncbi:hypothetical protein [Streptomyces pacificus]|uniref:Uncharacterized protein n=1 Tax=Streptomyces pacificus TaxID=2705029 RepID=A0A6A0AUF0_9ACTN|nr:hypothetical protein [Streptomyces pacificus]GFH36599.1 hypothetical protein SCWH03_28300 [Streptomyces pacificus]